MSKIEITLPYPPKELNPNKRIHWSKKHAVFSNYHRACHMLMLARKREIYGATNFKLTFCAPDKRHRDLDNMLSSFKAGLDGISHACRVDDSNFKLTIEKGEPVKGGAVIIEVLPAISNPAGRAG